MTVQSILREAAPGRVGHAHALSIDQTHFCKGTRGSCRKCNFFCLLNVVFFFQKWFCLGGLADSGLRDVGHKKLQQTPQSSRENRDNAARVCMNSDNTDTRLVDSCCQWYPTVWTGRIVGAISPHTA